MNSFVVADPNKCIGCRTCEIACVVEHSDINIFTAGNSEIAFNPRLSVIKTKEVSVPIQCRQCEDAPCANVCPNGALFIKEGVVQVDEKACIGCKTCVMACPFGAIQIVEEYRNGKKIFQNFKQVIGNRLFFKEKMTVSKCDLCADSENGPACEKVCPTQALKIVKENKLNKSVKDKRKQSAAEIIFAQSKR
ncbi:MAG: 4Fe-4S dicluster domain-containing protein [Thermotaleaceae bacterium]